jgi:hypothetical protein
MAEFTKMPCTFCSSFAMSARMGITRGETGPELNLLPFYLKKCVWSIHIEDGTLYAQFSGKN